MVFILQIPLSYAQQIRLESHSASRPWAASSLLLQAFKKAVISAEDPSMGQRVLPAVKKIYSTRGGIC